MRLYNRPVFWMITWSLWMSLLVGLLFLPHDLHWFAILSFGVSLTLFLVAVTLMNMRPWQSRFASLGGMIWGTSPLIAIPMAMIALVLSIQSGLDASLFLLLPAVLIHLPVLLLIGCYSYAYRRHFMRRISSLARHWRDINT